MNKNKIILLIVVFIIFTSSIIVLANDVILGTKPLGPCQHKYILMHRTSQTTEETCWQTPGCTFALILTTLYYDCQLCGGTKVDKTTFDSNHNSV